MANIKYNNKIILFLIIFWAACAFLYPSLPEKVPSHWNIHGEIDGYVNKSIASFVMPALPAFIYILMSFFANIDPRADNYEKFSTSYEKIKIAITLLMVAFVVLTQLIALGYQIKLDLIIRILLPVLFVYLGNYFGKLRHNYFIGIRTPWTLANEVVWMKTHRLGGKLMVLGGIIALGGVFFNPMLGFVILMLGVSVPSLFLVIYSYWLYSQLKS